MCESFTFVGGGPADEDARMDAWEYDRQMYKRRNEIERLFRRLKSVRRIFSRFEKLPALFLGHEREPLLDSGWPKMAFIEHCCSNDPTNWWVANRAGVEAMLRSSGLRVTARPADEIYLCEPDPKIAAERWHSEEQLQSLPGAIQGGQP